jgi:hypothetical protein
MIGNAGCDMHVVLEQERHSGEGSLPRWASGFCPREIERPFSHATQPRLRALQMGYGRFDKLRCRNLPVPYQPGEVRRIKQGILLQTH